MQAAKQTVLESLSHDAVPSIKSCQRHGTLLDSLSELEPETRLVIIGRQGEQSAQQHGQVGSQLESVVRVLHTPVLMALPEFKVPSKVMFAYDGSATGRSALTRLSNQPAPAGDRLSSGAWSVATPSHRKRQKSCCKMRGLRSASMP